MPEEPPIEPTKSGGGGTDPGQQQTDTLIAGKFKDEAAFKEAFASLASHEKIGLPELAGVAFENTDRAVNVYKRLESILKQPNTPAPKATSLELGQQQQQPGEPPKPMSMQELVAGLGVEQDKLNAAVMGGKLDDDVYGKFGKAVITLPDGTQRTLGRDIVDQFLGAQAQGAQYKQVMMQQAAQHVGGQDKLDALIAFGGTLSKPMQQSINVMLGNPETMQAGLDHLNHLYAKHVGSDGSNGIVSGTAGATASLANKPFKSLAEKRAFAKEHGEDSQIYKSRVAATPVDAFNRVA